MTSASNEQLPSFLSATVLTGVELLNPSQKWKKDAVAFGPSGYQNSKVRRPVRKSGNRGEPVDNTNASSQREPPLNVIYSEVIDMCVSKAEIRAEGS